MLEIRTEITLEAPAERIWTLLADGDLYPRWNPLFPRAKGEMAAGGQQELAVHLPGIDPFVVRPTLLEVEPGARFCWRHVFLTAGLFAWHYCLELEARSPQSLSLVQRSRFCGLLAPLFNLGLAQPVADGLARMNDAIRRWGEKGNIQCLRC